MRRDLRDRSSEIERVWEGEPRAGDDMGPPVSVC